MERLLPSAIFVLVALATTCIAGQSRGGGAAAVPAPKPAIPTGSWAPLLNTHPRLLGSAEYLKQRAQAYPEDYQVVKSIVGESTEAAGIVQAVEGLTPDQLQHHLDRAKRNVGRGPTNEHQDSWIWLTQVAESFDFLHDQIAPADRQAMIDWMNAHLASYTTDETAFHNSTLSKILCYLKIAYATWGENPKAPEFRDYAIKKLYEGKVVPILLRFGQGGGFTECGWYSRGSLMHLASAMELARRFEHYDGFQKAPQFYYQRLAYEMHQPYPGLWLYGCERYAMEGDGADTYGGFSEHPRTLRTILAQYFRGSELSRYVASKRRQGSNPQARLVDFLWDYQEESPKPLDDFPLSHIATGIGKVYARSDWSPDASWLRFECGDYWCGHQHFEAGNFEIFRYEPLATESGEYYDYTSNHDVNWLLRTIAHNCLLVYVPGEQWKNLRDGDRNPHANDGGQAAKWDWTKDNLPAWDKQRADFERGDIVAFEDHGDYLYVAGDATAAYSPEKLRSWVRQIVFLRPHTFVIFDRVVSTKPEYEKTWLLHMKNEPALSGNTITIANGKGAAVVQTLLPEHPKTGKIYGYTYGGQTFAPVSDRLRESSNLWRVEVKPSAPAREDLFLHVVFTDAVQPTALLQQDGAVGARIGDALVLFKGKVGGSIEVGGNTRPLRPGLITDDYE
jgi:hypothetical protein